MAIKRERDTSIARAAEASLCVYKWLTRETNAPTPYKAGVSVRRVASRAVSIIDGFAPEHVDISRTEPESQRERAGPNSSRAPPKKAIRRPAKEH